MYLEIGTYNHSFYTAICQPSSVYISEMGCNHRRIHHFVDWKCTVPEIISDRFKIKEKLYEKYISYGWSWFFR